MSRQEPGDAEWTVLVVDDEPSLRFILARVLEQVGYTVVQAAHGGEALDYVHLTPPLLVITDRMMPVMNGDELIKRLRADASTAAIPIVLLTGTPGSDSGADAILAKPFDPINVVALVDRLTGRAV